MKKTITLLAVVSILSFLTTESFPQQGMMWQGSGGWGMGGQYCGMYNTQTIETISGEVVSVDKFTPMPGMSSGIRMMMKTDKETLSVHLGPAWYIENQDFKIEPNDKVIVKGSRITFGGQPAIMAAQVRNGDKVLTLWSANGYPLWSGSDCCGW
ncbi:MAG: DNA-binding protein [Thermodesulfobacteriota bacterium]